MNNYISTQEWLYILISLQLLKYRFQQKQQCNFYSEISSLIACITNWFDKNISDQHSKSMSRIPKYLFFKHHKKQSREKKLVVHNVFSSWSFGEVLITTKNLKLEKRFLSFQLTFYPSASQKHVVKPTSVKQPLWVLDPIHLRMA